MKKKHTPQAPELAALRQAAMKKVEMSIEQNEAEILEERSVEPVPPTQPDKQNRYDYQDIKSAPRNGALIIISETGGDKGEIAFWKKTRAFANATHRWEETGFFVSNITNMRVSFTPNYWRSRSIYEV